MVVRKGAVMKWVEWVGMVAGLIGAVSGLVAVVLSVLAIRLAR